MIAWEGPAATLAEVLRVEPGDVVVVRLPEKSTLQVVVTVREQLEGLWPDNQVVVTMADLAIHTLRLELAGEDAARLAIKLRDRRRRACDALGNGAGLSWSGGDLEAVAALLRAVGVEP